MEGLYQYHPFSVDHRNTKITPGLQSFLEIFFFFLEHFKLLQNDKLSHRIPAHPRALEMCHFALHFVHSPRLLSCLFLSRPQKSDSKDVQTMASTQLSLSLSPHRFMFQQLHSTNLISSPLSESHGLCAGSRTFCMSPPDAYYYIGCLHNNQRCWIHFSASLCLRTSAHLEIGSPLGFRQLERALPHHHHSLFICGSCRALSVYPCSRVFQDNTAVNLAF